MRTRLGHRVVKHLERSRQDLVKGPRAFLQAPEPLQGVRARECNPTTNAHAPTWQPQPSYMQCYMHTPRSENSTYNLLIQPVCLFLCPFPSICLSVFIPGSIALKSIRLPLLSLLPSLWLSLSLSVCSHPCFLASSLVPAPPSPRQE